MNKEELEKKLQEAIELFNQVNSNIEQLTQTREQLRGKVLAYQEMLQAEKEMGRVIVDPKPRPELTLVADEEDTEVEQVGCFHYKKKSKK